MSLKAVRAALAALLVTAIGLACVRPAIADEAPLWRESPSATAAPELSRFNALLADLAERLKPALVHVRVRRAEPPAKKDGDDDTPEPRRSTGSGFIIEPSGLIVTNDHVVENAEWIEVRLADGRRFTGRVLGEDVRVDLALLRISGASELPTLPLGDSNKVRVGEFVLALGHPFGLEQSVSFGIVSRKGAPLTVAVPGFDFIQTDAAINPGNSGGPLVNMAGEVIGVNSMAARNGSIGFAIPSSLIKLLLPQLATKGKIEWGWLGVSIAELTDEDLGRLKLREPKGVLVRGVMPGEPADQGGLKADDVIVAVDGAPMDSPRDLQRVVSTTPVGKRVHVVVWRDGKTRSLDLTVGMYKDHAAR